MRHWLAVQLCVESDPMFVAQGQFAILTWLLTRSAE
jgi:hypothetical protein